MRPLVCLALLLPALAAPLAAPGAEGDLESLQRQLAQELAQRIDRDMRAALAVAVREHESAATDPGASLPVRVDSRGAPAGAASAGSAARGRDAPPTRMSCRTSTAYSLECVVVSRRPGLENIARAR